MSSLLELTAEIVSAHASKVQLTSDEMLQELQKVHASLKSLESGSPVELAQPRQLTLKQAFKKEEVVCMVCGKGGFKTLKRHLAQAHGLKPGQYRKQFSIPSSLSLTARSYSESRRQTAIDKGLAEGLAKAREVRAAKVKGNKAVPAVRAKTPVPAVRVKAPVPAVAKKAAVPAKVQEMKNPAMPAKSNRKK